MMIVLFLFGGVFVFTLPLFLKAFQITTAGLGSTTASLGGFEKAVGGVTYSLDALVEKLGGVTGELLMLPMKFTTATKEADSFSKSLYNIVIYGDKTISGMSALKNELYSLSVITRINIKDLADIAERIAEAGTVATITVESLSDIGTAIEKAFGVNNRERLGTWLNLQTRVPGALKMARAELSTEEYGKWITYLVKEVGPPAARIWER